MTSPEILYEDKDLVVINKPPFLPVHAGDTVSGPTLVDFLLEKFPEIRNVGDEPTTRPGIVHRLDKNTSGVIVVARTQKSFELLKHLFKNRLVEKIYYAVVCGRMREQKGIIEKPIGRLVKNPLKRGVETPKSKIRGAREAITEFRVLKSNDIYSLVELKPKTGRMHQLRVHLKSIGHPVACDLVYGGKWVCCPEGSGRMLLHAQSLALSLEEGRRLAFDADPPSDFQKVMELLGWGELLKPIKRDTKYL